MFESSQPVIELKIKWDGPLDSLNENRLSVGLFATPLRKLLTAVRRTASNMLREGSNRKETDTGRFATEADQIDIQIADLIRGSSGVQSIISVQIPPGQMGLWPEGLAADAVDRVLLEIDRESHGIRRSNRVREYLESLPTVLTSQDYWLYSDGNLVREVHLGPVTLPTGLESVPYLVEVTGRVIGVGFAPGPNFVRLKTSEDTESFSCSNESVFRALEMRDSDVRIFAIVRDGAKRLLRIQALQEPRIRLNEDQWIFERWRTVLNRLAQ